MTNTETTALADRLAPAVLGREAGYRLLDQEAGA